MPSARYWGIRLLLNADGNFGSLTELQFRSTIGGANIAQGMPAFADSTAFGWVPANAFNGSTASPGWHSGGGYSGKKLWCDFTTPVSVAQVGVSSRTDGYFTETPSRFDVIYSDDAVNWNNLFTAEILTPWGGSETRFWTDPALLPPPPMRTTQVGIETAFILVPDMRTTLVGMETAFIVIPEMRTTQIGIETAYRVDPNRRRLVLFN